MTIFLVSWDGLQCKLQKKFKDQFFQLSFMVCGQIMKQVQSEDATIWLCSGIEIAPVQWYYKYDTPYYSMGPFDYFPNRKGYGL